MKAFACFFVVVLFAGSVTSQRLDTLLQKTEKINEEIANRFKRQQERLNQTLALRNPQYQYEWQQQYAHAQQYDYKYGTQGQTQQPQYPQQLQHPQRPQQPQLSQQPQQPQLQQPLPLTIPRDEVPRQPVQSQPQSQKLDALLQETQKINEEIANRLKTQQERLNQTLGLRNSQYQYEWQQQYAHAQQYYYKYGTQGQPQQPQYPQQPQQPQQSQQPHQSQIPQPLPLTIPRDEVPQSQPQSQKLDALFQETQKINEELANRLKTEQERLNQTLGLRNAPFQYEWQQR